MRTKHQLIMDSRYDPVACQLLDIDERPWYIPDETKRLLILQSGSICNICRRKTSDPHIDHIHPVSRGGKVNYSNLQVLCRFCNLSKSDHLLDPVSYIRGYPIPIYIKTERQINNDLLDRMARSDA